MPVFQFLDPRDIELEEVITRVIRGRGKHEKVHAIVRDGRVNLAGSVGGLEGKNEITQLVEALPGVKSVVNHLRINAWEELSEVKHF